MLNAGASIPKSTSSGFDGKLVGNGGNVKSPVKQQSADPKFAAVQQGYDAGGKIYFPSDLTTKGGYIFIRISKDYKFKRDEVSKKDTQATIFLPLPNNLATAYNAQYNTEGLGPIGNFVAGEADEIRNVGIRSYVENLKNASSGNVEGFLKNKIKNMGFGALNLIAGAGPEQAAAVGLLLRNASGGILGAAAGSAIKGGLAGIGVARNPHLATLFQGTNFRTHEFSYKFTARDEKESLDLEQIIRTFKYHMLPSYTGGDAGHFFNYPEQFDISIVFPGEDAGTFSFDIGASVLKNFTVNYAGEGAPISLRMVHQQVYKYNLHLKRQNLQLKKMLNHQ